jgi:hypothetical protein
MSHDKPTLFCYELWPDKCCDSCHDDYESGYQVAVDEYDLDRCRICIICCSSVRENDESGDRAKVQELAYAFLDKGETK